MFFNKKAFILFLVFFLFFPAAFSLAENAPETSSVLSSIPDFTSQDRVLILAPHPDDESIGTAGVIQKAIKAGADVYVTCYTNGDANQLAFIIYEKRFTILKGEFIHMGEVRRKETIAALKFLGVNENNIFFLGYPDVGTMQIMRKYWGPVKPYKSMLTRVMSVPYNENLSPGAPYIGDSILKDIETVLLKTKPTKIFVSHPADTNGDHQSLYLFLQVALWDLGPRIKTPLIYPYLVHCIGWPIPRGLHPEFELLPPENLAKDGILWQRLELTEGEVQKKDEAFGFYKSQIPYNPRYMHTFARKNELFGDYPVISLKENITPDIWLSNKESIEDEENDEKQIFLYAKKDNKLYIKLALNRKVTKGVKSLIYLLGYSKNTSFSQMPKIRLVVSRTRLLIYNKKSRIFVNNAKMYTNGGNIIIELPLAALNSPNSVLVYARTYTSSVPRGKYSWRILRIE